MPGSEADRHLPPAQVRSRSTCSTAVTATGTTCWAASASGTSRSAASRQQLFGAGPVGVGRPGLARRDAEMFAVHLPDQALLDRTRQVEEEQAVEPLGPAELRR